MTESKPAGMLVMDLDGTLIRRDQVLSDANRTMLDELAANGVVRVVATGRSLFAAERVIDEDFPIDYLVFSSGAGTVRWPDGNLIRAHDFEVRDVERAGRALLSHERDFMLQARVPDTHNFRYHRATNGGNADFERRVERYRDHATPLDLSLLATAAGSHFVAIEPPGMPSAYEQLREDLTPLHVVRTTSPLDHESRWIEIYPEGVGKSFAAERLRVDLSLAAENVFAVGNDFNDEDLLTWSRHAFVVANAHEELKSRYAVVPSNEDDGVSEVARRLLAHLSSTPGG